MSTRSTRRRFVQASAAASGLAARPAMAASQEPTLSGAGVYTRLGVRPVNEMTEAATAIAAGVVVMMRRGSAVTAGDRQEFVMSGAAMAWHDLVLYLIERYVGAASAMYLCGGIGIVGMILLALSAGSANLLRREPNLPLAQVGAGPVTESD